MRLLAGVVAERGEEKHGMASKTSFSLVMKM